jgi:hypothetical protein
MMMTKKKIFSSTSHVHFEIKITLSNKTMSSSPSSAMFYGMGFFDNIIHKGKNSNNNASLLLSAIDSQLQKLLPLTMSPVLVLSVQSRQIEFLLIAKNKHDEGTWGRAIASLGMLHIQTTMMFDDENGQSCMERLIAKQISLNGSSSDYHIDDVFLDAYRIASQGLMHYLDTRIWTMKKENIRRLHQVKTQIDIDIEHKTKKRYQVNRQIMVQHLVDEHVKILCDSDPAKYIGLSPMLSETHDMDIQKLEDEELELISEMDLLYQKSGQIISILRRQVDIQDMMEMDSTNNSTSATTTTCPISFIDFSSRY